MTNSPHFSFRCGETGSLSTSKRYSSPGGLGSLTIEWYIRQARKPLTIRPVYNALVNPPSVSIISRPASIDPGSLDINGMPLSARPVRMIEARTKKVTHESRVAAVADRRFIILMDQTRPAVATAGRADPRGSGRVLLFFPRRDPAHFRKTTKLGLTPCLTFIVRPDPVSESPRSVRQHDERYHREHDQEPDSHDQNVSPLRGGIRKGSCRYMLQIGTLRAQCNV